VAVLWRELGLLSGFLDVNLAKLKLKILIILILPQQVTEMKTWLKVTVVNEG
jgi:hypothetical protein